MEKPTDDIFSKGPSYFWSRSGVVVVSKGEQNVKYELKSDKGLYAFLLNGGASLLWRYYSESIVSCRKTHFNDKARRSQGEPMLEQSNDRVRVRVCVKLIGIFYVKTSICQTSLRVPRFGQWSKFERMLEAQAEDTWFILILGLNQPSVRVQPLCKICRGMKPSENIWIIIQQCY